MSTALLNLLFAQTIYKQACDNDAEDTSNGITPGSKQLLNSTPPTREQFVKLAQDLKNHPLNSEFNLSPDACKSLYSALLPSNPSRPTESMLKPLMAKLYESYKRDIVIQIKNDEMEYRTKLREVEQIEKGRWDSELMKEIKEFETERSQLYQQQQLKLQRQLELQQRQEQERKRQLQKQKFMQQSTTDAAAAAAATSSAGADTVVPISSKKDAEQAPQEDVEEKTNDEKKEPEKMKTRADERREEREKKQKQEDKQDDGGEEMDVDSSSEEKATEESEDVQKTGQVTEESGKSDKAEDEEENEEEVKSEAKQRESESNVEDGEEEQAEEEQEEEGEGEEEEEEDEDEKSKRGRKRKRQSSPSPSNISSIKKFQTVVGPLLANISTNKSASFFSHPVNANDAPNYNELIYSPTDLRTIKAGIKDGTISSTIELERELEKMFANAIMYNAWSSDMSRWAREMQLETESYIAMFRTVERNGRSSSGTPGAKDSDDNHTNESTKRRKK